MELKAATFCCLCDDFKFLKTDAMSTAEVMTAALAAAAFFSGSCEKSRKLLERHRYLPAMLSKSQFNRRLTKRFAIPFHKMNSLRIYFADSFPAPGYRNIRIRCCEIYQDECFRGYISSRKECFYGLKVHALPVIFN